MPIEVTKNNSTAAVFRPPQEILDVFWALSDGADDERNNGTVKLCKLIEKSSDELRSQILKYCVERLIRGLSSNRKFARVGFSVALAQLLRQFAEVNITNVIDTVKDKLRLVHQEKKSKAEVGGIFMGRAFAISAIIQSGRISQLKEDELDSAVKELLKMSDKKSYLKPVSNRIIEDIIAKVSSKAYEEQVWPKIKVKLEEGWELCTLDKISLLLTCREKFPKVTKKKFLKKYWGHPLFSEDNDVKLMKSILDTAQKSEILLEKILPHMLQCDRDIVSIWKSIGEKLMESPADKKKESMLQRQLVGVQIATRLLATESSIEQVTEMIMSPALAKSLFPSLGPINDKLASLTDVLLGQVCLKLKALEADILEFIKQIWHLEVSLSGQEKSGTVDLVNSHGFNKIIDLMSKEQAEKYTQILSSMIKGKDKWKILSEDSGKKVKQLENCIRHLQHIVCSQQHTSLAMQKSVLSLFIRLASFQVEKKTTSIEHCERCCNFSLEDICQKLCESAFNKCLDALSTLNFHHQSKYEKFSNYLQLLCHLVEYIQTLLTADTVKPLKTWTEEIKREWDKLFALVSKIKEEIKKEKEVSLSSAFLLLFLFLGIHMLSDFETSSELLKDVYICYERATREKKKKSNTEENEPHWVEVVIEVLLSLLLMQSHLGRVITTTVFKSILGHVTPAAMGQITGVLIPKKVGGDDAGGVLVDADVEDDEDDDEEDVEVTSHDDDDSEEDDSEDEEMVDINDDEEDEKEVDEEFRKSVKGALGKAAPEKDDDNNSDEDLPDLSDSEMFQLDNMLAEVFRQRKMAGGKKAREEKRKETENFRIRVLDLVEATIKSERCGDFLIDLLNPILLLMLKTSPVESQVLCDKANSIFTLLKSKAKGQKDSIHSEKYHKIILVDLIELAQSVVDSSHVQAVSAACFTVMNLTCVDSEKTSSSVLSTQYIKLLKETLQNVLKKPKNNLTFFSQLIDMDPVKFQMLAPEILKCLNDETTKTHTKMICCSLLTSLAKKTGNLNEEDKEKLRKWMTNAADFVQQMILSLEKQSSKVMLTNNVLSLAVALQSRNDIFQKPLFDDSISKHLKDIKSSFNTDLRRLSNKLIAFITRSLAQDGVKKDKKKRKIEPSDDVISEEKPAKKKRKL